MLRRNAFSYIFLIIAFTGVECDNGHTEELYSKLLKGHNYLVPPNTGNISVSVNLELLQILQIDTRNQEMTFSAMLNLDWKDSTLSWDRTEFSFINRVTFPSDKIWTPNVLIWNSATDSNDIRRGNGNLFISANGQVHWPIFGYFKTACTIDVTYYPFDQQTCVVKIGTTDHTIQLNLHQYAIDLNQFYMSVYWNIIEAPAYLNVYKTNHDEFPSETDVTYYLTIRRKTHWLSEVCPSLALAFITIIPAVVVKSLEKLMLQVFCITCLFALHNDIMNKLPPTSLVIPSASIYILALISFNLIHLSLTAIINNRRFQWIVNLIDVKQLTKKISESNNGEEGKQKDVEIGANHSNRVGGQTAGTTDSDKIVAILNWIILVSLIVAVVISTLRFLFDHPH